MSSPPPPRSSGSLAADMGRLCQPWLGVLVLGGTLAVASATGEKREVRSGSFRPLASSFPSEPGFPPFGTGGENGLFGGDMLCVGPPRGYWTRGGACPLHKMAAVGIGPRTQKPVLSEWLPALSLLALLPIRNPRRTFFLLLLILTLLGSSGEQLSEDHPLFSFCGKG